MKSILKAYKYRLYPTMEQAEVIDKAIDLCRFLYNSALEQRIKAYRSAGVSVHRNDQINELPGIKGEFPEYKEVHSQVLQDVFRRLDKAFDNFFRRVREGKEKAGFPRFKGQNRYDSFTYPQPQAKHLPEGNRVYLPKIGIVKIKLHRPLEGKVKTITITRKNGKYYISFSCEVDVKVLPSTGKQVGIDVGLTAFATTSDGECFINPRSYRKAEKYLKRMQREVSRRKKGSNRRRKSVHKLAKAHEKVANQRKDIAHKVARSLVNRYDLIAHEDLKIRNMVKNHHLAKSISDAGWNLFFNVLGSKAEEAGRIAKKINPAFTSQICSCCGALVKKDLSVRIHHCPNCSLVEDRDVNSGKVILAIATNTGPDGAFGNSLAVVG